MLYWGIMGLLVAVALGLIIAIVVTLKKNNSQQDDYDYDDYDYEDEYEENEDDEYEEEEEIPRSARARRNRRPDSATQQVYEEPQPPKKTRKQWKVILENLDTWEKFSYIFYDNVGIGRRNDGEFEKFLTIREDPRVSKVHCAIVRKEDHLYLKDMGSRNGTYLNGQRIYQPTEIQRDDVIRIGETEIEVKKVLRERD